MPNYLLYTPEVETIEPDEQETFNKIVQLMTEGQNLTREKYGRPLRISHAKAHAVVKGQLVVRGDLPLELAQGLFSKPGTYDVLVRMSAAPGELLDDSKVNSERGIAVKVFGVEGPRLATHTADTQDFVFEPGKEFIAGNARSFLQAFKPNAQLAPKLSDTTKGMVSTVARVTNKALETVGVHSAKLDFFGAPVVNPMGDGFYSQTPFRHGDYVAKLAILPDTPALKAITHQPYDQDTPDAMREACNAFLRNNPAEYSFRVQLNTGLDDMPVEDATRPWSEESSQYQEVARLIIPPQTAWDPARDGYVEPLSFSPDHSLLAHQPLGSINRARLVAYAALSKTRRAELQTTVAPEPVNAGSLPA